MGIHWSLPLLETLLPDDLLARLNEAQNDPSLEIVPHDEIPIINGLTGNVMKALPIPRNIRVSRRKMRAFCTQGLDVQVGRVSCADVCGVSSSTDTHASTAKNLSIYLMDQTVSVLRPHSKTARRFLEQ